MLSIIIPSFCDSRILTAIASVKRFDDIGQTQVVIIDGGSDDSLLMQIRSALSSRDVLICEPDKGIFDAINKGLERADGNMIGWLGSDDIFSIQVRASDVIDALRESDIYVAGTAMIDKSRVIRQFWLPAHPERAAFLGLHNPHFSTFGRVETFRQTCFDITSPVADVGYFLEIFSRKPRVRVDHRVATLMQVGGFSNGSLRKNLTHNAKVYLIFRAHMSAPQAALALLLRIVPKIFNTIFYKLKPTIIDDYLLRDSI